MSVGLNRRGSEMEEIKIRVRKGFDFSHSLVVVAFPTAGLSGTIAADFIVEKLELERVGGIYSKDFTPAAIVIDSVPSPVVRIHGKERSCGPNSMCKALGVIMSEIPLPDDTIQDVAEAILHWCDENGVEFLVAFDSVVSDEEILAKPKIFGAAPKKMGRQMLKDYGIDTIPDGVIVPGLSGALLASGELHKVEVVMIVAQVNEKYPNSRAAARLLEAVNEMLLKIKLDPEPLYKQAEELEAQIKASLSKAHLEKPGPALGMYG